MTLQEYKEKVNPCYGCPSYDSDTGCTMPSIDRTYACSLEDNPDLPEQEFLEEAYGDELPF